MAMVKSSEVVCRARRVYYVAGLRRSGNHAVINWVGNSLRPSLLCNNGMLWPTHVIDCGSTEIVSKTRLKSIDKFGSIIYGLENLYPDQFDHRYDVVARSYGRCLKEVQSQTVLLLRDPFNTFSSIFHHEKEGGSSFCLYSHGQFACLWVIYAQAYLQALKDGAKTVGVDFNRWSTDINYRLRTSQLLGFEFDDRGIERVTSVGHGSSFFVGRHMTDERRAGLGLRYTRMLEDEEKAYRLWEAVRDDRLLHLARLVYPEKFDEVWPRLSSMAEEKDWEGRLFRELG